MMRCGPRRFVSLSPLPLEVAETPLLGRHRQRGHRRGGAKPPTINNNKLNPNKFRNASPAGRKQAVLKGTPAVVERVSLCEGTGSSSAASSSSSDTGPPVPGGAGGGNAPARGPKPSAELIALAKTPGQHDLPDGRVAVVTPLAKQFLKPKPEKIDLEARPLRTSWVRVDGDIWRRL